MKIFKYEMKHINLMLKKSDSLEICSYWKRMKLGQIFSNQLGSGLSFKLFCGKKNHSLFLWVVLMPTSRMYITVYAVSHEIKGSTGVDAQIYTDSRNWNSYSTLDLPMHSFMVHSKPNSSTAYCSFSTRWKWRMHLECSCLNSWSTFSPHSSGVVCIN